MIIITNRRNSQKFWAQFQDGEYIWSLSPISNMVEKIKKKKQNYQVGWVERWENIGGVWGGKIIWSKYTGWNCHKQNKNSWDKNQNTKEPSYLFILLHIERDRKKYIYYHNLKMLKCHFYFFRWWDEMRAIHKLCKYKAWTESSLFFCVIVIPRPRHRSF